MIDIIMATYNGSKYIKAQVLSLISQNFQDWRLHVYDDCSTDDTINIVQELCAIDKRIFLHTNEKNVGCALTFLNGICQSNADFIMLCDQDDIWFDSKLEVLHKKMLCSNPCTPKICFSRGYQYDEIERKITGRINMNVPLSLSDFLLLNGGIQGCSMIINRPLVQLIKRYSSLVAMHDHHISALAFMFGEVEMVDSDLMLYRKHGSNVTNSVHGSKYFKYISFYRNNKYLIDGAHFLAIQSLYTAASQDLSMEKRKLLEEYLHLPSKNKHSVLISIYNNRLTVKNSIFLTLLMATIFKTYGANTNSKLVRWEVNV